MSFTVTDFHDLVHLLEERPEWRTELRRLVLSADFLEMPGELAKLQRETAELQRGLTELRRETEQLRRETERRFQELVATQERFAEELAALTRIVRVLADDVGKLKGTDLERRYRERPFAHFGRLIRRAHVLTEEELADLLEAGTARGVLSENEADQVTWADLVVRGKRRDDGTEVSLVVEVFWGVGPHDVARALERARLLARLVSPVLPVVAGEVVTPEAARRAVAEGVWQVLPGRVIPPQTIAPGSRAATEEGA